MPRGLAVSTCCTLELLACCTAASAQSNESRLDEAGQREQADAPVSGTTEALLAGARRALAEDRPGAARAVLDPWLEANERSGNPLLPEALLLRGDALTALGDEYNALYDYERIIREFARTSSFTTAVERELNIAVSFVQGIRFDPQHYGEELLIRVQERMPGSDLAERACIELADFYYRTRRFEIAAEAYGLFVQLHPRSRHVAKALDRQSKIRRSDVGEDSDITPLLQCLLPMGGAVVALRRRRLRPQGGRSTSHPLARFRAPVPRDHAT